MGGEQLTKPRAPEVSDLKGKTTSTPDIGLPCSLQLDWWTNVTGGYLHMALYGACRPVFKMVRCKVERGVD